MTKLENILEYTNMRLVNWYVNAKRDYGIIGEGKAEIKEDMLVINYIEDGVNKNWSHKIDMDDLRYTPVDYFFEIWAEEC